MDQTGDPLFAGPALPGKEDGGINERDPLGQSENFSQGPHSSQRGHHPRKQAVQAPFQVIVFQKRMRRSPKWNAKANRQPACSEENVANSSCCLAPLCWPQL